MRSIESVKISLLPETVPTFLDNSIITAKGVIVLSPEITSTVKGMITLNDKSLFFLAGNLFNPRQSFELNLRTSEWGSKFSQISLPRQKKPGPPTRINAWWPKYGKDKDDAEYLAYTFAAMLLKAFRRPENENPFVGIKVLCHSLRPIDRLRVDVKVGVRKWLIDKYPKLLP